MTFVATKAARSGSDQAQAQALMVEKWSLLAWGLAEFGGQAQPSNTPRRPGNSMSTVSGIGNASKVGSNALNHFSCEGDVLWLDVTSCMIAKMPQETAMYFYDIFIDSMF